MVGRDRRARRANGRPSGPSLPRSAYCARIKSPAAGERVDSGGPVAGAEHSARGAGGGWRCEGGETADRCASRGWEQDGAADGGKTHKLLKLEALSADQIRFVIAMKPAPHCLPSIVLRAARRLGVVALLALSMVPPAWATLYVPPVVTSIARLQPGPVTTANTLTWRVTFNMTVNGVDSSDFTLTPVDGSAPGTLYSVAAGSSAAEYIVTATGVSGTGTLRLDVNASGTDIIGGLDDLPLAGGFTLGQPYTHTSASMPVAWGWNRSGQLGNNFTTDSPVPVDVLVTGALAGKTVVAVAAGYEHSLALCSDGTVAAWGSNMNGQLGNNSTDGSPVPVAVNTDSGTSALFGKTVVAVAAGDRHSLALCSDGTVAAWGVNPTSATGGEFGEFSRLWGAQVVGAARLHI